MDDDETTDEIIGLYKLSNCIRYSFQHGIKNESAVDEIVDLYCFVSDAIDLLVGFDCAEDEDIKHEFGFQYSEVILDVEKSLDAVNTLGISFYIH